MKINNRLFILFIALLFPTRVKAQLIPDETLGAESSTVNAIDELNDRIDNGAIRGPNLFHSFSEFNVNEGRGVFFHSPTDIQNILTRVTGSNISNISGKLGVLGEANLFLINPNGIIFGENASLDISGSFVSTTANALQFGEQGFFSASNPEAPPLLTVQPSAFFFNQINTSPIENNSIAAAGIDPAGNETSGLRVPDGSSLLMIGGDVVLNGGNLQARGGRIELGGLQGEGVIDLDIQSKEFNLNFPVNATLSNIFLNQGAEVNVRGEDRGSLAINAQNFNLTEGSILRAGIDSGLGSINSQAGNIDINVIDKSKFTDGSLISHVVNREAIGNGGDINIKTGSLELANDSQITTSPLGQGDGGNININATDSIAISDGGNLNSSTVGMGNAGDINLNSANSIALSDDGQLISSTLGTRDAGDINLNSTNSITISDSSQLNSSSFSTGDGGDINLNSTNLMTISDDSQLSSFTVDMGKAGDINLNASDIFVNNGSQISNNTFGMGKASNINLDANNIFVNNGSQLSSSTQGSGSAGNINLNAQNLISFDRGKNPQEISGAFSVVGNDGTGDGGEINITTGTLFLTNGAQLSVTTFGQGDAGEININARNTVSFDGVGSGPFESGVFSGVFQDAEGDSGNININTDSLSLNNSAVINANTSGNGNGGEINITTNSLSAHNGGQIFTTSRSNGNAGNINLNIAESLNLSGTSSTFFARLEEFGADLVDNAGPFSGLFANTSPDSTGNSGNITINGSDSMIATVQDEAQIAVDSAGRGVGGEIALQGSSLTLDRGVVTAEAVGNQGGNITLKLQDLLLLRDNSQINSSAGSDSGAGDGGNINIDANLVVAFPLENSDITANAFLGNGGRVTINTQALFGTEFREELTPESDITASSTFGLAGLVEINTPEIQPTQGLIELPTAFAIPQMLQGCQANRDRGSSSFINTGRGGLPPNPYEPLESGDLFVDVQLPRKWVDNSVTNSSASLPTTKLIVQATGWIVNEKGNLELVSDTPETIPMCGDQDHIDSH